MNDSQPKLAHEMVNLFTKRLTEFDISKITDDALKKLDEWRDGCHKTIDEIYQHKLTELNSYIEEIKVQCETRKAEIRTTINQLQDRQNLNEENSNHIQKLEDEIENKLKNIKKISIRLHVRPVNIDNSYVHIEKDFRLSQLTSTHTKFSYSALCSSALASNGELLLIHQYPNLCLIDRDCRIVKQKTWDFGWIRDMCWSTRLGRFIIILSNGIYLVNDMLEYSPASKQDIESNLFSCTCSDERLYLSTYEWGSSIFEYELSPDFHCIKQWEAPQTCGTDDGINDIKYNNKTLALMINDSKKHEKRMELKSINDFTTIWSLPLSAGANIRLFTCCPIDSYEWLVIDGTNSNIYHVTKDGNFKANIRQNAIIYRANRFTSNIFAMVTEDHLDLYRLS